MHKKIIGFAQLRNELSKGNLRNWFKFMGFCDYIYIYDQNSDDGSRKVYEEHENAHVIYDNQNNFKQEIKCKSILLNKLLEDHPDCDWIFWMDGDTGIDNRLIKNNFEIVRVLIDSANKNGVDSITLGHYNLWRSFKHFRLDSQYNFLDIGVTCFWRNNGALKFPHHNGLHGSQLPDGLNVNSSKSLNATVFKLIHYGFSTDYQIITKYDLYKSCGQTGYALERLLDEQQLQVEEVEEEILPSFIDASNCVDPTNKKPIREIYNE
tara:strand:- start:1911 stop:2705 length:795 start_codon:yes stop_codon:yes gene_type:complete